MLNQFLKAGHDTDGENTFIPSGEGALERTVADRLNETISVKDFGAIGDGQILTSGANTISGSPVVTRSSGSFAAEDVGKLCWVKVAATYETAIVGTIQSVDGSQATLDANATASTSGGYLRWGTDDTAALQAALDYAYNFGFTAPVVAVPRGMYVISDTLITGDKVRMRGLVGGLFAQRIWCAPGTYTHKTYASLNGEVTYSFAVLLNRGASGAVFEHDQSLESIWFDGDGNVDGGVHCHNWNENGRIFECSFQNFRKRDIVLVDQCINWSIRETHGSSSIARKAFAQEAEDFMGIELASGAGESGEITRCTWQVAPELDQLATPGKRYGILVNSGAFLTPLITGCHFEEADAGIYAKTGRPTMINNVGHIDCVSTIQIADGCHCTAIGTEKRGGTNTILDEHYTPARVISVNRGPYISRGRTTITGEFGETALEVWGAPHSQTEPIVKLRTELSGDGTSDQGVDLCTPDGDIRFPSSAHIRQRLIWKRDTGSGDPYWATIWFDYFNNMLRFQSSRQAAFSNPSAPSAGTPLGQFVPVPDNVSSVNVDNNSWGKAFYCTNAGAISATLKQTASVGCRIRLVRTGPGTVNIAQDAGVTLVRVGGSGDALNAQYETADCECVANSDGSSAVWRIVIEAAAQES